MTVSERSDAKISVFISYCRDDLAFADSALARDGYTPFDEIALGDGVSPASNCNSCALS
jgi:hypothetical protein